MPSYDMSLIYILIHQLFISVKTLEYIIAYRADSKLYYESILSNLKLSC